MGTIVGQGKVVGKRFGSLDGWGSKGSGIFGRRGETRQLRLSSTSNQTTKKLLPLFSQTSVLKALKPLASRLASRARFQGVRYSDLSSDSSL